MNHHQNERKVALVCGANQGIGLALVKKFLADGQYDQVFATHRRESPTDDLLSLQKLYLDRLFPIELDPSCSESFDALGREVGQKTDSIDCLVNCVGFLHNDQFQPEKNLGEVSTRALTYAFEINTAPTLFLAQQFQELLLKKSSSVFATLSAKVGSIEDNRIGGWYSYRISKAALNMGLKNLSIEFNRLGKKCTVMAIHPGTTESRLSEPFLANARKKYQVHTADQTADNIFKILQSAKTETHNGKFLSWDGRPLPW